MKAKKSLIYTCLLALIASSAEVYSASVDAKLNDLHSRLKQLEAAKKDSGGNVQLHGVVEVEYGYHIDYTDVDSSDIVLATVELAIEASINNNVDAEIVLLHEEDDTPLEVDVGVINLHAESSPLSLSLGQMYVPFGMFDSNLVSDPLTLELGETRESSILVNYEMSGMLAGLYVFNGDIEEGADEDKVTQFGISLNYESDMVVAGIDYISSISDTDAIQDHLGGPITVISHVAGISAHASFNMNSMSIIIEYLGALDAFDVSEIPFNGVGAEPSATNIEFGVEVGEAMLAVGYQATEEALDLGAPETRLLIAYSTEIYEATSLSFEYAQDSDYELTDGGSGETADTITIQLATEF